jgi:hypothetical protein
LDNNGRLDIYAGKNFFCGFTELPREALGSTVIDSGVSQGGYHFESVPKGVQRSLP